MDGGRRILRSIKGAVVAALPLLPAHASASVHPSAASVFYPFASSSMRSLKNRPVGFVRRHIERRWVTILARPGFGLLSVVALFSCVGLMGWGQNGGYDTFIAKNGAPWDMAARALGFEIAAVTITGQSRVSEKELLAAAGVGPQQSLPFLDPNVTREKLLAIPLVKAARVMKLYPNRLVVTIEERMPYALWQREGQVFVVSEDGVSIDALRTDRYLTLPFVVGEGAQKRLPEYVALMKSMGDFAHRVKAGIRVADRRWDLDMTNGVTVRLSEQDPAASIALLLQLQRESRILDKDILSIDLRARDRVAVRLTEEGLAAHEALTHKPHKGGG